MMENGGVIVFDDVGYPAINAVVRFVLANHDYEVVEVLEYPRTGAGNRGRRLMKRLLRRLVRTDKDPAEKHQHLFRQLEFARVIALRKVAPDTRRWDHYCAF